MLRELLEHPCFFSLGDLIAKRQSWKAAGEKVVFTNGVFDLLHAGHIAYLTEAAALGSKLIVAINSDSSARRLDKGPHRPINAEDARALVIAALKMVDAVIIFTEPTPEEIIGNLLPDVLVKGGDYRIEDIAGSAAVLASGGAVRSLSFLPGFSTTAIELKIKGEVR